MVRLMDDMDSEVPSLHELIRPRVPLKPTTGNGPSPSPKKAVRSAKDFYDSQDEEHSGKESPFKSPSRALKLKRSTPGRQQRSLKLDNVDQLLLPKLQGLSVAPQVSPKKHSVRESPCRKAKAKVDYSVIADENGSSEPESDGDWKDKADASSDEDEDVFSSRKSPAKSKRSTSTTGTRSLSPKKTKSTSPKKQEFGRPLPPNIFEDSDVDILPPPSSRRRPYNVNRSSSPLDSFAESEADLTLAQPTSDTPTKRPATPTRLGTPPANFSPSKSRLLSPSKRNTKMPTPPAAHGRPSLDAFWDQDRVSTWTETHSPRKDLKLSPRKFTLDSVLGSSDSEEPEYIPKSSPRKAIVSSSPSKKQSTVAVRKAFNSQKQQLAQEFFEQLDAKITDGEIARLAETGGGVSLIWSKKLNSTAGRANWRREAIKRLDKDTNAMTTTGHRHIASIELAEKVIDDEARLYNVMAHEYCHLANFMVSRVINNPHGASFKSWASKTTAAFSESHGVEVTTKHDYDISYKYVWLCASDDGEGGCGTEYQRHSKSIDPARHTCGKCKGRLVQIKPKPRGGANAANGTGVAKSSGGTEYQKFVKEQFQTVKLGLPPGSPMKDVMKEIGVRYRAKKESGAASPEKTVEVIEVSDTLDDESSSDIVASPNKRDLEDITSIARKLDFLSIGGAAGSD